MPGPWRLHHSSLRTNSSGNFNLRREARPLATSCICKSKVLIPVFQSQTRSQAPGDSVLFAVALASFSISISDEKPGPWRPFTSGASPTPHPYFNLRREARPLATNVPTHFFPPRVEFQSQTRSQAPGDAFCHVASSAVRIISISDEKPGPWRRELFANWKRTTFNISISDEKPGPWRRTLQTR